MTDHPILFNVEMVRAILDGHKTMTRRVVKPQPPNDTYKLCTCVSTTGDKRNEGKQHWVSIGDDGYSVIDGSQPYFTRPYGIIGDMLWVRETWCLENTSEYWHDCMDESAPELNDGRPIKWESDYEDTDFKYPLIPHYRATEPEPHIVPYDAVLTDDNDDSTRWRPSIHMPRWASRITLEITGVKVERVQDISEEDAKAEGIRFEDGGYELECMTPNERGRRRISNFHILWDSISKPGHKWEDNPFVWAITFKRIIQ